MLSLVCLYFRPLTENEFSHSPQKLGRDSPELGSYSKHRFIERGALISFLILFLHGQVGYAQRDDHEGRADEQSVRSELEELKDDCWHKPWQRVEWFSLGRSAKARES